MDQGRWILSDPLRIIIGFDRNEVTAFHVLTNSILRQSSKPVEFLPLHLPTLEADNLMWRKRKEDESTDFSFSRFLTPHLCNYHGKALFLDCDMVVRGDIAELFEYLVSWHAVAVCKHDYKPKSQTKFLGHKQSAYPRKLWSAVTLFNCNSQKCRNLSPLIVNEQSGAYLHRFEWVGADPTRIGEIPEEWHWIPHHSESRVKIEDAKLIHFTEGGPWFDDYKDRGSKEERIWLEEAERIVPKAVLV